MEHAEAQSTPRTRNWTRVGLMHPVTGEFLARESGVSFHCAATPFGAMAWDDANTMALWLAHRPAYLRRKLADEGWISVRFEAVASLLAPAPAVVDDTLGRPVVAEAAGYQ